MAPAITFICLPLTALLLISIHGFQRVVAVSADNAVVLLEDIRVKCANSTASERDLREKLFEHYDTADRPKKRPADPVVIIFSLVLEAIKDVSIRDHSITVSGYLYVNWYDDYLTWKQYPEFECINLLVIPADMVWLPDIAMMNVPHKYELFEAPGEKVRLYNDGYVHFRPGGLFSAICEFDLTYFPYDEQVCQLRFQSWLYLHTLMKITLDKNPIVQSRWTENEEWDLVNMSAIITNVFYSNPTHHYDGVYFTLVLRRRVGFFIVNVIIPGTIISLLELVTFTLDSGEPIKIHISFTCLLAFQVFQLMVIPEMPQSSMHTPLLSIYIILAMSYIGLAVIGQGSVFLLLHRCEKGKYPPQILLTAAKYWSRALFIDHSTFYYPQFVTDSDDEDNDDSEQQQIMEHGGVVYVPSKSGKIPPALHFPSGTKLVSMFDDTKGHKKGGFPEGYADELEEKVRLTKKKERRRMDRLRRQHWTFIISVVDRFVVCVYSTLVIVTPLIMFMIIPGIKYHVVRTLT